MVSLFPIHRPKLGISFRAHALDLVEVRRGWGRTPTVTRVATRPLPAGLLTPNATTSNISDPAMLAKELAALLDGLRDRAVIIDLPMACGTLALHHFETLPSVRTEQEALLRWRLRQEEHLTAPDLTLLWQVFDSTESGKPRVSVLSVAIKPNILAQYHQVCEEAGLIPVSMGWSTFHLLELARVTLATVSEDLYVAHRTAEALIVLGFRQGCPVCLRVKPWRRAAGDLHRELLQTLRYFAQQGPPSQFATARTTPLYVVDETASAQKADPADSPPETWLDTLIVQDQWTVSVTRAEWATVPIAKTGLHPDQPPFGALAGLLAA